MSAQAGLGTRPVVPARAALSSRFMRSWKGKCVSLHWWYSCYSKSIRKRTILPSWACLFLVSYFTLSTHMHHISLQLHYIIYMSDCENPRFTERTFTNLGRSHRLPHVCTIMIYGKLGGYRLQEAAVFIYIYDELWLICDIWVSLMWILEKYDDITLKRGIANLGRSHRLPRVFNNFHQFP